MKKTTKAVLWSALVIPGAGHIFLKRYGSAVLLLAAALTASYFLISSAVSHALIIHNKILSGEVPPDIANIRDLISQQTAHEAQMISTVTTVLIITWLIGIIDSYRIARTQENNLAKQKQI